MCKIRSENMAILAGDFKTGLRGCHLKNKDEKLKNWSDSRKKF